MVTETWVQNNRGTVGTLGDLRDGAHIELIRRDCGRLNGGGAITFDNRKTRLKKYADQNNR